jgi:hypothetical protein
MVGGCKLDEPFTVNPHVGAVLFNLYLSKCVVCQRHNANTCQVHKDSGYQIMPQETPLLAILDCTLDFTF